MTGSVVHCEDEGPVRTLTLDSPHNRNALSTQLMAELADGLRSTTDNDDLRLIVITGTGRVFCSGADLSERSGAVASNMPDILSTIRTSPVPVIVRVNGHTRAGGVGLVAAADMAVAPASSTFAFSEVRVGVAPAMIMVPALRIMERRFLSEKMLTGDPFGAAEAAAAGLLTAVVPETDDLSPWVAAIVQSLLKAAPGAVAATKALLAELPEASWSDGLAVAQQRSAELFASDDAAEGMDAFLHKRTPAWDVSGA